VRRREHFASRLKKEIDIESHPKAPQSQAVIRSNRRS
jgi:hypothetical protein